MFSRAGVVLNPDYFPNSAYPSMNSGALLVHETGHWVRAPIHHLSLLTDDHRLDCLCSPIPLVDQYLTILFMLDITRSRVAVMPTPKEAVTSLQVCLVRHLRVWKLMSFSIDTPAESSPSTRCPVGRDVCHFHLSPNRLSSSLTTELPRPPWA